MLSWHLSSYYFQIIAFALYNSRNSAIKWDERRHYSQIGVVISLLAHGFQSLITAGACRATASVMGYYYFRIVFVTFFKRRLSVINKVKLLFGNNGYYTYRLPRMLSRHCLFKEMDQNLWLFHHGSSLLEIRMDVKKSIIR